MALSKKPTPATTAPAGEFESMDEEVTLAEGDTTVDSQPAAATASAQAAPVASAPEQTPRVAPVAVRPANAVSSAFSMKSVFDDLNLQIGVEMLEGMGFGSFPRITVNAGGVLVIDKTRPLGDVVEFSLESWNFVTMVVTGEQNNKEADKLIRSSYDGVNLADGSGTIADYVERLKTDGYAKTSTKKYIELYGAVISATHKGVRTEVADEDRKLYQVSVSPQSVKNFGRFQLESRMRASRGIKDSNRIILTGEATELNGKMFGLIQFSPMKASATA